MEKTSIDERRKMAVVKRIVKEAVVEAFEDIGLSKAIEEGMKSKKVDKKKVFEVLDKKI